MQAKQLYSRVLLLALAIAGAPFLTSAASCDEAAKVLDLENAVAWCIVPFDAAKRTPEQRAQMLVDLKIYRCAYDWRAEHVPTFEQEILAYKKHGIDFFAFWGVHEEAFELFKKYNLHPQIWIMSSDPQGDNDAAKTDALVESLTEIAERTKALGCKLGLYNHGGWAGEPKNMVAVCRSLHQKGYEHVGIVYNFHHGHEHITDWSNSFALMQPLLLCVNLNGMNAKANPKILAIGEGEFERQMIRVMVDRGYQGPIGLIDHRDEADAKESLQQNIEGLKKIQAELTAN